MNKPLLIIGIDPGTTTAFAALDTYENILAVSSSRDYNLSAVITEITKQGLPLIVGCDKRTPPSFVKDFATKVGARLIAPEEDLSVCEKQELIKEIAVKLDNEHEKDALACALFALKKIRNLLQRIQKYVTEYHKEHMHQEIIRLVLLHEDVPIKVAAEMLEHPEEREVKLLSAALEKKEFSKEYLGLYEHLRMVEKENALLRKYTTKLQQEIKKLKNDFTKMLAAIKKQTKLPVDERLEQKERTILALQRQLREKEKKIEGLLSQKSNNADILKRVLHDYKREKYK